MRASNMALALALLFVSGIRAQQAECNTEPMFNAQVGTELTFTIPVSDRCMDVAASYANGSATVYYPYEHVSCPPPNPTFQEFALTFGGSAAAGQTTLMFHCNETLYCMTLNVTGGGSPQTGSSQTTLTAVCQGNGSTTSNSTPSANNMTLPNTTSDNGGLNAGFPPSSQGSSANTSSLLPSSSADPESSAGPQSSTDSSAWPSSSGDKPSSAMLQSDGSGLGATGTTAQEAQEATTALPTQSTSPAATVATVSSSPISPASPTSDGVTGTQGLDGTTPTSADSQTNDTTGSTPANSRATASSLLPLTSMPYANTYSGSPQDSSNLTSPVVTTTNPDSGVAAGTNSSPRTSDMSTCACFPQT